MADKWEGDVDLDAPADPGVDWVAEVRRRRRGGSLQERNNIRKLVMCS